MDIISIDEIWSYLSDAINTTEVTTLSAIIKLFVSLVLGSLVGFERERKGQIAGIRTFALIAMGATLAMLLSIYIPQEFMGQKSGDPGRIAAQVITGIGFLGAGAIIQMKGAVRGLTTAAGIWMIAIIGLAIGVGLYILAIVATAFILTILVLFERYQHKTSIGWNSKVIVLEVDGIVPSIKDYKEIFKRNSIHLSDSFFKIDYENNKTTINFLVLVNSSTNHLTLFQEICANKKILSISLTNEITL